MKDAGRVEPRDHRRGAIEQHDPPLRIEGNQSARERFAQDIREVQDILPEACGSFAFNVHLAGAARSRVEAPQSVSERKQHDLRAPEGFHNQKFGSKVRRVHPGTAPDPAVAVGAPDSDPARFDKMSVHAGSESGAPGAVPARAQLDSNTPRRRPVSSSMLRRLLLLAIGLFLAANNLHAAQTRDQMVLADRDNVLGGGKWIYNDFTKGLDEAARTGKPLLVVLRCVP